MCTAIRHYAVVDGDPAARKCGNMSGVPRPGIVT